MSHHLLHLDEWQYVTSVEYLDVEAFHMKQTQMYVDYVHWRIYSSRDAYFLEYKLELIYIGNYTGFYTIATIQGKCELCS